MSIPVIDLRDSSASALIAGACEGIGFFQVVGHGVDPSLVDRAWHATRDLFEQPASVLHEVRIPDPSYPYGYIGFEEETLASSLGVTTPPDRKHTFSFGPIEAPATPPTDPDEIWVRSPNQWPTAPDGFRAAMEAYYAAMSDLAARVLRVMATALGLEEHHFDPMIDRHVSALRCLDYPQLERPPLPGQLRAGAHTDYGTLTILRTAPGINGLEARAADGRWVPIDAVPDGFVVNIGDSLAQWTNDRWRSTLHRVVEPAAPDRRTSIAFFHNANWDAVIECLPGLGEPKYAPVRAGRHLMQKFQRTVS